MYFIRKKIIPIIIFSAQRIGREPLKNTIRQNYDIISPKSTAFFLVLKIGSSVRLRSFGMF